MNDHFTGFFMLRLNTFFACAWFGFLKLVVFFINIDRLGLSHDNVDDRVRVRTLGLVYHFACFVLKISIFVWTRIRECFVTALNRIMLFILARNAFCYELFCKIHSRQFFGLFLESRSCLRGFFPLNWNVNIYFILDAYLSTQRSQWLCEHYRPARHPRL